MQAQCIITGQDARVAAWMFETAGSTPMQFNMALGLSEDEGETLSGGIMFTNYNGSDAEVHFVGPGLLKTRVVRTIFYIAATVFKLNRLTVHTRKLHMARGCAKLGAEYEGKIKRLYGPTDDDSDAGLRFVFWKERIEELAGLKRENQHVRF